ncbi:antibiotic biosynthesis monooxygenase family protein [Zafaria sp. Z1313]|jgi:heme-degrading monooxygenase HmoA|uniref:antibiotic biosynthesis monooxygenase family protein n=1 Tax=Micrococcaceae TaxID=1268 RepID=UPI002E79B62D|nr:antibiotic biosynthesis monooxygenase family protein [Zafaria sp. J156]MEE1622862.1 antibiotic biosynthesis monooxygenase family protein [Zafaria sp. J156]
MIYEVATLTIKPGSEAAFEDVLSQAVPLFQQAPGALSLRVDRTVENMSEYTLIVGWATLEDHTERFRSSTAFTRWRELAGPHFAQPPQVKHTQQAYLGF